MRRGRIGEEIYWCEVENNTLSCVLTDVIALLAYRSKTSYLPSDSTSRCAVYAGGVVGVDVRAVTGDRLRWQEERGVQRADGKTSSNSESHEKNRMSWYMSNE
jgi:hypothetical protein